jgi:N-acyl-L-homoserine lactone synthetase
MIHMVTQKNRGLFASEIEEMHHLRKVHFVDERNWSGMTVVNDGEYDQCDDERTIYFLALDDNGRVGVSMRARPTDDLCIVADTFPQLIHPETAPVKNAKTWEISRIFATRAFRSRAGLRRRDQVFLASMEAALANGVTRLVGIIDTFLLPQAMRFPWDLAPLGLPSAYPEGEMIGVQIPVSREELDRVREAMAQDGSIIETRAPIWDRLDNIDVAEMVTLLRAQHLPPERLRALKRLLSEVILVQNDVEEHQIMAMINQALAAPASQVAAH